MIGDLSSSLGGGLKKTIPSGTVLKCIDKAMEACRKYKSGNKTVEVWFDCIIGDPKGLAKSFVLKLIQKLLEAALK